MNEIAREIPVLREKVQKTGEKETVKARDPESMAEVIALDVGDSAAGLPTALIESRLIPKLKSLELGQKMTSVFDKNIVTVERTLEGFVATYEAAKADVVFATAEAPKKPISLTVDEENTDVQEAA